jgi:hypothetical protein
VCAQPDIKPDVGADEYVNLKVLSQDGSELFFKIKKKTSFKKLMDAYCQRQVSTEKRDARVFVPVASQHLPWHTSAPLAFQPAQRSPARTHMSSRVSPAFAPR